MTADQELQQLLSDTDAALPPPPARGLTAAALDRLLTRRRVRALLAGGVAVIAAALGTARMLQPPTTRAAEAAAAAELANLRVRMSALLVRVEGLRGDAGLEPGRRRTVLAIERAAVAGAQCAASLEPFDPIAAARQRALVADLHPDTFAARNLASRPPEEHR